MSDEVLREFFGSARMYGDLAADVVRMSEEIAKLRDSKNAQLAAAEKERGKALEQAGVWLNATADARTALAASEKLEADARKLLAESAARELALRGALEKARQKFEVMQMKDDQAEAAEALSSTEPPALLGVLKEVEKRLHDIVGFGCVKPAVIDRWAQEALASLRAALRSTNGPPASAIWWADRLERKLSRSDGKGEK